MDWTGEPGKMLEHEITDLKADVVRLASTLDEIAEHAAAMTRERDALQAALGEAERALEEEIRNRDQWIENYQAVQNKLAEAKRWKAISALLREAMDECHLMISRRAMDFQGDKKDWDPSSLPARVRTLLGDLYPRQENRK